MGTLSGEVDRYPADRHDLESWERAQRAVAQMQWPVLVHADNPRERLYIAALDGTNNRMEVGDEANWSVVAKIHGQVLGLRRDGERHIASGYVEGIGTQRNPIAGLVDGVTGYSFDERVESAYYALCAQAKEWLQQDPQAQIRVAGLGFSRGAEEAAALLRMVHERGIRDPGGATLARDHNNLIRDIAYADRPLLVAPGKTVQTAILLDPVSTGVQEYDRRLPSSVVAAYQSTAEDERRDQFKSTSHVEPGLSADGRFNNARVGGTHSNIGDTYRENGLGTLSFNLSVDLINALSDTPLLRKRALPDDPAMYMVHRSDQHLFGVYTTRGFADGVRDHHNELGGDGCRPQGASVCDRREPVDAALAATVEWRHPPIGALPSSRTAPTTVDVRDAAHPGHGLFSGILERIPAAYAARGQAAPAPEERERIAASLGARGGQAGLSRADHVLLSVDPDGRAGERLFVVQGRLDDPAHARVQLPVREAAQTPLQESSRQLEHAQQQQAAQQQRSSVEMQRPLAHDAPSHAARVLVH